MPLLPDTATSIQVLHDQTDPAYMARLAQQRRALLDTHVWQEQENGEWWLVPVVNMDRAAA